VGFEDSGGIASARQLPGSSKSSRAASDDGYLFFSRSSRLSSFVVDATESVVCGVAMQGPDEYWAVHFVSLAIVLARMRAYATEYSGERCRFAYYVESLVNLTF
jgi:hypothetical protein